MECISSKQEQFGDQLRQDIEVEKKMDIISTLGINGQITCYFPNLVSLWKLGRKKSCQKVVKKKNCQKVVKNVK
jgi:hypothetical protein